VLGRAGMLRNPRGQGDAGEAVALRNPSRAWCLLLPSKPVSSARREERQGEWGLGAERGVRRDAGCWGGRVADGALGSRERASGWLAACLSQVSRLGLGE
jgi:hypothetical protein